MSHKDSSRRLFQDTITISDRQGHLKDGSISVRS
jgi:hypothetical protein